METNPKIIYRQTSDRIIATIDSDKFYLDKTVHLIIPQKESRLDVKSLLAILNSHIIHYIYMSLVGETGRTFAQVKTVYVKNLPIKIPNKSQESKIISLVNDIFLLKKSLGKLGNKKTDEVNKIQEEIRKIDYEIDQEVYKLYGITKEEQKIIEESLK